MSRIIQMHPRARFGNLSRSDRQLTLGGEINIAPVRRLKLSLSVIIVTGLRLDILR